MNRKIGMAASAVNILSVAGFALCMLIGTAFGSYLICMFIAFSFVPMMSAFCSEAKGDRKTAGITAVVFGGIYAALILLVYFAQTTAVATGGLSEQAAQIIDYSKFGLFFSYDLLGYGLMALATFFAGLTIEAKTKADKWLKRLLLIHGIFFFSCFVMPMLGVFTSETDGAAWIGTAILEFWCAYFIPVGILSFLHFRKNEK